VQNQPTPTAIDWRSGEISWPLALAAGFAGTWLGIECGVPGAGVLLSAGALAPLWAAHQARGRAGLAGALACGWLVAGVMAHVGCAWEDGFGGVAHSLPGGRAFAEARLTAWARAAQGGGVDFAFPLLALVVAALVALVARPAAGFLALVASALAAGFAGVTAGRVATGARAAGWDPVTTAMLALPPSFWLAAFGTLLLAAGIAAPGPFWPLDTVRGRRRLMTVGLGLLAAGLLLDPLLTPIWAGLLSGRGALDLPVG
jgi:hypothetical protein